MLRKLFFIFAALFFCAVAALSGAYAWLVVLKPGEEISRENIEKILAIESPVYYRDGVRRVGVFFKDSHRQYVKFSRMPANFVQAIVAAEDSSFFHHYGLDFVGVGRALIANIKAGRVVQGGSTITQQTAKNLFKRRDRSLKAKLKELLYALRLEYHYSKEDILEFYANQFYVSGNGRGLGMAARYFFDKKVEELDLLECAFIAGSVKGPNRYNPFVKQSEKQVEAAKELARQRAAYVLDQMLRLGFIDREQFRLQEKREIPFKQGQMTYTLNTVLDLVREGLNAPEVREALARHGIDNVATSGVKIVSAVDGDLQDEARLALRKELSRLDVRLRGYDHRAAQEFYRTLPMGGDWNQKGSFMVGRIKAQQGDKTDPLWGVEFSPDEPLLADGGYPPAFLDSQGVGNLLRPLVRYRKNAWSEIAPADMEDFAAEMREGDLVYVSVREVDSEGVLRLDLEKYPQLQGGVLALEDGAIRAMVGGWDNHHYNRAIAARRPMGSVLKPLVYAAAMQLGWSNADSLDNRRNVFVYQNMPYFPRPMHKIDAPSISMTWAGVRSENLASVWLLYHLCDHLPPARFAQVVEHLGLGRKDDESMVQYTRRIRDEMGVVVDSDALWRAAFHRAVRQIEPDLLFAGASGEFRLLQSLEYGARFDDFAREIREELMVSEAGGAEIREGSQRLAILERNFLRYRALRDNLLAMANDPRSEVEGSGGIYSRPGGETLGYFESPPASGWRPLGSAQLAAMLPPAEAGRQEFWSEVVLDGELRVATVDLLEEMMEVEYQRLAALPPYDFEVLQRVGDFRVLVALHYLIGLSRALGVESELDPVLSFPLGSNVLSLLEVARIFEAMRDGNLYSPGEEAESGGTQAGGGVAIIERIETSDGELVYAPRVRRRPIFSPRISLALGDMLSQVMEHGTGRSAQAMVNLVDPDPARQELWRELGLKVPMFGKTGTANRFVNAAFAGFLPAPAPPDGGGALSPSGGYTLASYVGFDDNQPMVRGSTRITGASGALPVWARLADVVFAADRHASSLDLDDLAFSGVDRVGLAWPRLGQVEIPVEDGQVVMVSRSFNDSGGRGAESVITTFGKISDEGKFVPERFFHPYWNPYSNISMDGH